MKKQVLDDIYGIVWPWAVSAAVLLTISTAIVLAFKVWL